MIIVTGIRSGTSLMMQTLSLLGVPLTGLDFHREFSHRDLNPKGYWALPMSETLGGIQHHRFAGTAVKLGGADLAQTPPAFVRKVIWCRRDERDCKESMKKLLAANEDWTGLAASDELVDMVYRANELYTLKFLKENGVDRIEIFYEDMVTKSEETLTSLCVFLDIAEELTMSIDTIAREASCR